MKTKMIMLFCIVVMSLVMVLPVFTQSSITVGSGPPYAGFTVNNSDRIIFGFDCDPVGIGDADIPMLLPASGSSFDITKNSLPCPTDSPPGCYGSLVMYPESDAGSFTVSGGSAGSFNIDVSAPVTPGTGDWIIDPPTNADIQFVRAIPHISVSYPAEVYSGASGVTLDASATYAVFKPATLSPTPALTSFAWTQVGGPAVTLSGASTDTAAFDAPTVATDTDLVFQLEVSDDGDGTPSNGDELTAIATVTVTVLAKTEPVDVVLLMDTSGSMGWHRTGSTNDLEGGCCSRLASAKLAAKYLVDRLGKFADDSRLGAAIFPAEKSPSTNYGDRYYPAHPSTELAESGDFNAVKTAIGGETEMCGDCIAIPGVPGLPTGIEVHWNSTPTQYGLDAARTMLTSASGSSGRSRVIMLLSDGAWNLGSDPSDPAYLAGFVADDIKIYTLGMGTGVDNVNHASLQDISVATNIGAGGDPFGFTTYNFGDVNSEPNLIPYLEKMMGHMISLDFSVDPPDLIYPGQMKEYKALITSHDTLASFTISWESSEKDILYLKVIAPDDRSFDPTESGNGFHSVTVDHEDLEKNPGTWRILVKNPAKEAKIVFNYSAMIKSTLNMKVLLDKEKYNTNDKMVIEARLIDDNRRLTGAEVYATIRRPDMGIGNWHFEHRVSPGQVEEIPDVISGEPLRQVEKKNIVLLEQQGAKPPRTITDPEIILNDEGINGDKYPNDGIYSGTYKNFTVPGIYKFKIFADGKTIKGQKFHREREVQKFVDMGVNPETTIKKGDLQIFPRQRYGLMTIWVTPLDKEKNYLGPGYEREILIKSSSGKPEKELEDLLDGTYKQEFIIDPKDDPLLTIIVRGVVVFRGRFSELKDPKDDWFIRK